MSHDDLQSQVETMRRHVLAGTDSFTLGPVMLATLIDESDALRELHQYGEAYGIQKLLNFLPTDDRRRHLLEEVLQATKTDVNQYELALGDYIGCFWLDRDKEWSWYPKDLAGTIIHAPRSLISKLYDRQKR